MRDKSGHRDMTDFLLSLALILFMIDIALRRLNLNLNKLKVAFSKINTSAVTFIEPSINKIREKHSAPYEVLVEEEIIVEKVIKEHQASVDQEKISSDTLDTSQLLKNKRFKK